LSKVEPIFNSLVYRRTCSRKYVDFAMCDVGIFTSRLYVLLHFISPFQCIWWEVFSSTVPEIWRRSQHFKK